MIFTQSEKCDISQSIIFKHMFYLTLYYNKTMHLIFHQKHALIKKLYSKSTYCDKSNFSEFHQDTEYASYILFSDRWIFADFVA